MYVYIISGRGRDHLDSWFEDTGVGLSAEHGCFYKHPLCVRDAINPVTQTSPVESATRLVKSASNNWFRLADETDLSWRESIRPLFHHYTQRTPGSFIEEKEVSSFDEMRLG